VRGFPLIYVNKQFEVTTGYQRSEILGQNCRFLQSDVAEEASIKRLSEALRSAQPVKAAITNKNKNGPIFKNLLAMKPLFDERGDYAYVLGIQFDITSPESTPARLKMANELLMMVPDQVFDGNSSRIAEEVVKSHNYKVRNSIAY